MATINELLGELVTPEIETALKGKHIIVADAKDEYVPKARLNEVITQRDELKAMSDKLSTDIGKLSKSSETLEAVQGELTALKDTHTNTIKEYENNIATMQKTNAIIRDMTSGRVKNTKAVLALVDTSKISLDGDNLIGLDHQLSALEKTDSYLFHEKAGAPGGDTGGKHKTFSGVNPFSSKTTNIMEQMKLVRENPALAEKLKKEAD